MTTRSENIPPAVAPWGARPRRAVNLSSDELVREERAAPGQELPVVLQATVDGLAALDWAREHRDRIDAHVHRAGGVLLRGFSVGGPEGLERLIDAVAGGALAYRERSSPRSTVAGQIYTSTDHPPAQSIFLHNEQSYNLRFPLRIFFHCITAAPEGGATPLADCRRVLARIDPEVRRRFAEHGYMYVRNFGGGLGLSWQTAFQTEDPEAVEAYARDHGIAVEWLGDGRLRTRQVRPAIARHPHTGEQVWFNHATFFHVTTLDRELQDGLAGVPAEDLPNNTYYGDGSPIEPEALEDLRRAYREETVRFEWREGDVLALDNMLVAHGRDPFSGPRRVVVGMAEPFSFADAPAAAQEGEGDGD